MFILGDAYYSATHLEVKSPTQLQIFQVPAYTIAINER